MLLTALRQWLAARTRREKIALAVCGSVLAFVCVRVLASPQSKTVYPIYSASARLWWSGADLYPPNRPCDVPDGYRYSPAFAVLVTPFAMLPDGLGGVAWRLLGVAALFGAMCWFARAVVPDLLNTDRFAGLILLALPLDLQSINNGQANLLISACLLGMIASAAQQRWNLLCILLAVATICKFYPLVLGLVLTLLYPRQLWWRVPLALTLAGLLPFALQHPEYVLHQYQQWASALCSEDRSCIPLEHMYRDLWLLFHLSGLPLGRSVYFALQVSAGLVVAILCWHRQRHGWPQPLLLTQSLAWTCAWMMLLGPATESSSFALLAPSLALSLLEGEATPLRCGTFLLWSSYALFSLAVFLGGFRGAVVVHHYGIHVWASLLYCGHLLMQLRPGSTIEAKLVVPVVGTA